ncbi:unnamed protein product [Didymodactylos carnosus]|uniref:Uncharacterized protein n=1 Tax=Didymodactylos carnosus TaxID=1234261 RepID=A0A8S2EWC2_9BILA|nr:unnamed protein product [Didymodactylos carnosus]CAF4126739.1 unnamed protein product [Didymodactylos carnosus]
MFLSYRVYQKPKLSDLKRLENSLLKRELNVYIDPLELKPWEIKTTTYSFENALLQCFAHCTVIQQNIRKNSADISEQQKALRSLLIQGSTKKIKEEQFVLELTRNTNTVVNCEPLLHKTPYSTAIQMPVLKFLRICVYPILNTNVTLRSLFHMTCQSCRFEAEVLMKVDAMILSSRNVTTTEKLIDQLLFQCNSNDPCIRCHSNEMPKVITNTIIDCPQVFLVLKQEGKEENTSFLEIINFSPYTDEEIIGVQYYASYRMVACVYRAALNEFGSIFYCKDQKYHSIHHNKKFIIDKKSIKTYLEKSTTLIYQKVSVEGVDFLNSVLSVIDQSLLLNSKNHLHYTFNDFALMIKRIYPEVAADLMVKVLLKMGFAPKFHRAGQSGITQSKVDANLGRIFIDTA